MEENLKIYWLRSWFYELKSQKIH